MAIEGPLRELGIHDVFQLLDLSRKTGALRVTSELRDNEGTVFFDAGKVVFAIVRSNPHPLGTLLLRSGKITETELERARRIQEWSRIAHRVRSLSMIPVLAPPREDGPSLLDLLPNEWEVLTAIDGESDLRAIAASLARSDFDIAKVAYGLLTTGVVELRAPNGNGN